MKAKKLCLTLLLFVIAVTFTVGCTSKTEYDDKQVAKIETRMYNGEAYGGYLARIFDFETGTVTDMAGVSDDEFEFWLQCYRNEPSRFPEYENEEAYKDSLLTIYKVPVKVAEFSQENSKKFVSAAKSLGIYAWQEKYISDYVCDATHQYIIITFVDGTAKTTHCYVKYPKNFEEVEAAFQDYFGADAWCALRLR